MTDYTKANVKELRRFGYLMGGICFVFWSYYYFWYGYASTLFLIFGTVFIVAGLVQPTGLALPYALWMSLAEKIGWIMNRVILTIFYLLIYTPIAIIRRIVVRDPLQLRFDKNKNTYFLPKETRTAASFEDPY